MTWNSTEKEVASLTAERSEIRYEYFIHKVADQEQVWSLRDAGGWRLVEDDAGHECVPVWPHSRYAALCAIDEFKGSHPEAIPFEVFMHRWLPQMAKDNRFASVFPTSENKGIVVAPMELLMHLELEREKYE